MEYAADLTPVVAGKEAGAVEDMPTVPAVRFLGVVNGKHR